MFIRDQRKYHSVKLLCEVMKVNRAGFYNWLEYPVTITEKRDIELSNLIERLWEGSRRIYGYRKIHHDLLEMGVKVGKNRVHRLMKEGFMRANVGYKKKFKYRDPVEFHSNILNREFNPSSPNEKWVSDITYIHGKYQCFYLATVMDLYSRKIIGWTLSKTMTVDIIKSAVSEAYKNRRPPKGVLFHSDQGSQYTSYEFQEYLRSLDIEASMSRRGNCHDNACAESFFHLLKTERIKQHKYTSYEKLFADVFEYIELFYNPTRRHTSNNYLSPNNHEEKYFLNKTTV